jgi:hypothetical protein
MASTPFRRDDRRSLARQHPNPLSLRCISSSLGYVYTVVSGLTCRANRCAKNRSLDAR